MLVFSCISAHTPVLMPTIGKEEGLKLVGKTKTALEQLEQELYLAQPETLIVITPHGESLPDAVSINLNSKYTTNFEEFGDLTTKLEWKPDMRFIDQLQRQLKSKYLPYVVTTSESLDYGTSVPLFYLTQHLPNMRLVPIITSQLDMKAHFEIGREIKHEAINSDRRIAVIASADLSHRVGENSQAGFSPKGVAFDEKIQELLKENNLVGILDIDDAWIEEAQACGAKVLATAFGIMDEMKYETQVISYERPLGVGYLIASMKVA
ncbi:hypothetical protein AMJ57_02380 [Parcubacteria bacterium SG8_24]|nr:MAG: hypothetical protein AMJ57_02380 [Parcubacteria bacterium SG8_24]